MKRKPLIKGSGFPYDVVNLLALRRLHRPKAKATDTRSPKVVLGAGASGAESKADFAALLDTVSDAVAKSLTLEKREEQEVGEAQTVVSVSDKVRPGWQRVVANEDGYFNVKRSVVIHVDPALQNRVFVSTQKLALEEQRSSDAPIQGGGLTRFEAANIPGLWVFGVREVMEEAEDAEEAAEE